MGIGLCMNSSETKLFMLILIFIDVVMRDSLYSCLILLCLATFVQVRIVFSVRCKSFVYYYDIDFIAR